MKLSLASSYALRAVVHLAQGKSDQSVPSHVIAHSGGMPERFLVKLLKSLVNADILHSIKGSHGGFRLAHTPEDISVLDVIEAVDGPIRSQVPTTAGSGNAIIDKRLDAVCQKVAELVRGILRKVSITDLAGKGK
jgi:Rrf2 family protein